MATLYTLPAHLRAVLTQFIDAGAGPETLKSKLQAALDAPAVEEEADEGELNSEDKDENKVDEKPRLRPPTIDAELLESLVSWAGGHEDELRAAGLDPLAYGHISLLAGTQVYLSPKAQRLAKAAEGDSSPFLPAFLSPNPPSFGSEYRGMMRDLATVFNVLFSIFGAGGAVYVAATTGAGWSREHGLLLGILAGIVVAIADAGLIIIFKGRLKTARADRAKMTVKMSRGSGAIREESTAKEASQETPNPPTLIEDKKQLRLRRRAIGA